MRTELGFLERGLRSITSSFLAKTLHKNRLLMIRFILDLTEPLHILFSRISRPEDTWKSVRYRMAATRPIYQFATIKCKDLVSLRVGRNLQSALMIRTDIRLPSLILFSIITSPMTQVSGTPQMRMTRARSTSRV